MKILKGTNQRVPNKDEAKKQIDPVTLEVIHRRLVSIADEMAGTLQLLYLTPRARPWPKGWRYPCSLGL